MGDRIMDLDKLFYPESVAVVGASPTLGKGGKLPFYQFLKWSGFKGRLYPVNPAHQEIDGVRVFPRLDDVPEAVDLAICSVPARLALETVEAAVRKEVRFLHFFTSGFSEVGNKALEDDLVRAARKGRTRIVGPNCLGIHCNGSGVTFDPTLKQEGPGIAAFLGQSGGVTNNFTRMAAARKIGLNKAVSYGNQIDLAVEDYLDYFAGDDGVRIVAAYIEDIKDSRGFLRALSRLTPAKPVVILKGGATEQGARAAASHTGALAGRHAVWAAAMRQHRCIEVQTQKQLVDVVMLAACSKIPRGPRIAYLGAGGGTSVLFADLAVRAGLRVPELSRTTREAIGRKLPDVNTSTTNPVDLGASGFNPDVVIHALRAVDAEPDIDAMMLYITLDHLSLFETRHVETGLRDIALASAACAGPVIPILPKAAENHARLEEMRLLALDVFRGAGLAMFNSLQEAVTAVRLLLGWSAGTRNRES